MSTAGRTVFVTGCSSGIGHATALLFAKRGYHVVATSRHIEKLFELEETARKQNWPLRVTACDVTSEELMQNAIRFARETFGPIHILVNNAGYGQMGAAEFVSMDDVRRQFDTNVFGPLRLIQLVTADMRAAGWGRIINISSIVGRVSPPFGMAYGSSKHALEGMADTLRLELEPFGIQTVSILPGPVKSEFMQNTMVAELPDNAPRFYHIMRDHFLKRRTSKRAFEISAERVAEIIVRAAEAKRPKARYYLTLPAKVSAFGKRFITDRFMDRCVRLFYGLNKLERDS